MRNALRTLLPLTCATLVLASCGEDDPPTTTDAGGVTSDGGGMDGGGPRPDAGADAGSAADGGCVTGGCPTGEMCVAGQCVPEENCCDGPACGFGFMCGEDCRCAPATGCCASPGSCGRGAICREDCTCGPVECVPECADDEVCEFGFCFPRCFREGCPEGEKCTEGGCIVPACVPEDCLSLVPPLACDPVSGCFDPCDAATIAHCGAMGGECMLGSCVDTTCREEPAGCGFRPDCCGTYYCMPGDAPDPMCPERCGPSEATPDPMLCQCALGGSDIDPPPPREGEPVPAGEGSSGGGSEGGGGTPPGGGPDEGPPPRGGGCIDFRYGGGRPIPFPGPVPVPEEGRP